MNRRRGLLVAVAVLCMFAVTVVSEAGGEWSVPGTRSMSMGGAGVARPVGPDAVYWNPAALAGTKGTFGVNLALGATLRDTGLAGALSDIVDLDIPGVIETLDDGDSSNDASAADELSRLYTILSSIGSGDGIIISPNGGLLVNIGSIGAGIIFGGGLAVGITTLDTTNLVPDENHPNSFTNNQTEIDIQGLALAEIPIAYGRSIDLGNSSVNLGGAIKIMMGYTYDVGISLLSFEGEDVQDQFSEYETDTAVSVDLGAQYLCMEDALALGLVLKNLTSPEFETAQGNAFELPVQARAGVAYAINDRLGVAADLDLTENESLVDGYSTRQIGAGASFNLTKGGGVSVRGGLQKNLADDDSNVGVTLGASLGTAHICADVAVVLASDPLDFEEFTIPVEGLMLSTKVSW